MSLSVLVLLLFNNLPVWYQLKMYFIIYGSKIKLMKGKALGKHSLHEKTTASVLLKLFISRND